MRKRHQKKNRRATPKAVLRCPILNQAKSAVLNSLTSVDAQRGYRHAIDEFVRWYCSASSRNVEPVRIRTVPGTMAMPPLKAFHFKCIIGCEASSRASDREVVEPVHGTDPIMVSIGTK